jgi:hypothetical protein
MPAIELLAGQAQSSESSKALQACNDFLRLGPGRTLPALLEHYDQYTEIHQNTPPTTSLDTLKRWSTQYGWQARGEEYDRQLESLKDERRRAVMEEGLALEYERVAALKRLADFLIEQVYEQGTGGVYHNVWVPDVKQIGFGDLYERVDIERFNSAILAQLRATLADIAHETATGRAAPKKGTVDLDRLIAALPAEFREAFRRELEEGLSSERN